MASGLPIEQCAPSDGKDCKTITPKIFNSRLLKENEDGTFFCEFCSEPQSFSAEEGEKIRNGRSGFYQVSKKKVRSFCFHAFFEGVKEVLVDPVLFVRDFALNGKEMAKQIINYRSTVVSAHAEGHWNAPERELEAGKDAAYFNDELHQSAEQYLQQKWFEKIKRRNKLEYDLLRTGKGALLTDEDVHSSAYQQAYDGMDLLRQAQPLAQQAGLDLFSRRDLAKIMNNHKSVPPELRKLYSKLGSRFTPQRMADFNKDVADMLLGDMLFEEFTKDFYAVSDLAECDAPKEVKLIHSCERAPVIAASIAAMLATGGASLFAKVAMGATKITKKLTAMKKVYRFVSDAGGNVDKMKGLEGLLKKLDEAGLSERQKKQIFKAMEKAHLTKVDRAKSVLSRREKIKALQEVDELLAKHLGDPKLARAWRKKLQDLNVLGIENAPLSKVAEDFSGMTKKEMADFEWEVEMAIGDEIARIKKLPDSEQIANWEKLHDLLGKVIKLADEKNYKASDLKSLERKLRPSSDSKRVTPVKTSGEPSSSDIVPSETATINRIVSKESQKELPFLYDKAVADQASLSQKGDYANAIQEANKKALQYKEAAKEASGILDTAKKYPDQFSTDDLQRVRQQQQTMQAVEESYQKYAKQLESGIARRRTRIEISELEKLDEKGLMDLREVVRKHEAHFKENFGTDKSFKEVSQTIEHQIQLRRK